MALQKNTIAPDFQAKTSVGDDFELSKVDSKLIILYFYPKDSTPGCTYQACGLRDHKTDLEQFGAKVFGIGKGDQSSHKRFIDSHSLNFPLIVDDTLKISKLFGVLEERSMFGKKYMGIQRTTFIINSKDLTIVEVMEDVNPLVHADHLIEVLKNL